MASINLIDSFQEFKDAENIDRPTLMKVIEDVFKTLLRKKYGTDENFDVIVNDQTGDLEIFRRRVIVEDGFSEDDNLEIEYAEAIKIEPDYSVGEEVYEEMDVTEFGRRAVLAAKQTLASRIGDLKKKNLIWRKMFQETGLVQHPFPDQITENIKFFLGDLRFFRFDRFPFFRSDRLTGQKVYKFLVHLLKLFPG